MRGLKIAGIVLAIVAVIVLIIWAIRRSMIGKDVKTGVANDKIEEAAIKSGINPEVAKVVANAPSSGDALVSIGAPPPVADAIANGNVVSPNVMVSTGLVGVMDLTLPPPYVPGLAKGDKIRYAGKCYEVLSVSGVSPNQTVEWGTVDCTASIL